MNCKLLTFDCLSKLQQAFFIDRELLMKEFDTKVKIVSRLHRLLCRNRKEKHKNDSEFFNKFFGEIKPLHILCKKINCESILVKSNSSPIDAVLFFEHGRKQQFIEFTLAFDGQQRHLQLEHLKKFGRAPVSNEIKTNNKKKASGKREIKETPSRIIEKPESEENLKDALKEAIAKKANRDNIEYQDAWLVVSFFSSEFFAFSNEKINKICKKAYSESTALISNPFAKIYFVDCTHDYVSGFAG